MKILTLRRQEFSLNLAFWGIIIVNLKEVDVTHGIEMGCKEA